ncbi:MAG: metallophosphoesterase [Treponema sp.]|nr:metallophosphoesterase [Treponema sp.]
MKILCISDQIDPQVYSPCIKERFSNVDLILSAGDLPLDYLDFIISSLNKPLFFVFGNHHTEELKHYRKAWSASQVQFDMDFFGCGAIHIGTNVKTEGNFIVAGLGGSMRYNNGSNQFTEFEMFIEVTKIIPRLLWNRLFHGRFVDILLTHAPPRGIHDKNDKCHLGFKTYLWFMKVFKPKYLVHGHIHLYDLSDVRCTKWINTTVVNAYSHYIIDLGE